MTSPTATSAKPPRRVKPKTAEAAPPAVTAPEAPAAVVEPPESDAPDTPEDGQSRSVATQHSRALSIPGVQATFTERSLILPEKLTVKRWIEVVNAIDGVREGARWWFGDALNEGEARYGETYAQALDATKYDYATLRNLKTVAKKYKPEDRIYDVSWSHYHAAAGLPLDVAKDVLKQAEDEEWSVVQVRLRVKEIKSGDTDTPPSNGSTQAAPNSTVVVRDEDLPGIKPIADAEAYMAANPGKTLYDCGGCDRVFAEQVWHCVGCSGHWPLSEDECPNELCGQDTGTESAPIPTATTTAPVPSAAPRTVTGTVVTAADTGASEAITVLLTFPFADLDPSDIAASLIDSGISADPLASMMAVHHWLGQVIEAYTPDEDPEAEADDETEADDDDSETTEDDGLGELDFGSEDDQEASETDETDEGAAEDDTATTEAPVAATAPPAATRTGAWSTKGANVVPDAATPAAPPARPLADEPARPAPKPGSGAPVRKRRVAAAQS